MTQQERFDTTAAEFLDLMERKTAWVARIAERGGIDIEDVEYEEVKEDSK